VSAHVATRSPRAQRGEGGEALYQRDVACLERARRRLLECLPPAALFLRLHGEPERPAPPPEPPPEPPQQQRVRVELKVPPHPVPPPSALVPPGGNALGWLSPWAWLPEFGIRVVAVDPGQTHWVTGFCLDPFRAGGGGAAAGWGRAPAALPWRCPSRPGPTLPPHRHPPPHPPPVPLSHVAPASRTAYVKERTFRLSGAGYREAAGQTREARRAEARLAAKPDADRARVLCAVGGGKTMDADAFAAFCSRRAAAFAAGRRLYGGLAERRARLRIRFPGSRARAHGPRGPPLQLLFGGNGLVVVRVCGADVIVMQVRMGGRRRPRAATCPRARRPRRCRRAPPPVQHSARAYPRHPRPRTTTPPTQPPCPTPPRRARTQLRQGRRKRCCTCGGPWRAPTATLGERRGRREAGARALLSGGGTGGPAGRAAPRRRRPAAPAARGMQIGRAAPGGPPKKRGALLGRRAPPSAGRGRSQGGDRTGRMEGGY
jgi:hypothetical protein